MRLIGGRTAEGEASFAPVGYLAAGATFART